MSVTAGFHNLADDPVDILNWRRLSERLTTSGQPSEDQLAAIGRLGITHIVNLGIHEHEKALKDEQATVLSLGMTYIHLPVDFAAPTESDFDRFCRIMGAVQNDRVHVHCIRNARVTAFLYRYRRDVSKEDPQQAAAVMETVWRPGGAWAAFIGHQDDTALQHRYAGHDY
ncbi:protein tyrosine phosphatase family protein [Rhizobium terrae]|uniref:protein tyrosine phosphatase family protein n=1 Tax=Rhizobium terrae TaxID=2171756 RepID=UPI000E3CE93B|nr:protein tyrosine phosphatase family protein [Rhizobium terrae]